MRNRGRSLLLALRQVLFNPQKQMVKSLQKTKCYLIRDISSI